MHGRLTSKVKDSSGNPMFRLALFVALVGAVAPAPHHHLRLLNHKAVTKAGEEPKEAAEEAPKENWGADKHEDEFSKEYEDHDTSHVNHVPGPDDKAWHAQMAKHGDQGQKFTGADYIHDKQPSSAAQVSFFAFVLACWAQL